MVFSDRLNMDIFGRLFVVLLGIAVTGIGADYTQYKTFIEEQANNETFVRLFDEHLHNFKDNGLLKAAEPFPCKKYLMPESNKTTSVHQLRPSDVKVVAAIGDSITAGTGIKAATVLGLLKEDRGLSWSIGGDKTAAEDWTLANFLKVYNPDLQGYSTGWGPVWLEEVSHLNLANPGDKSEDMLGQAEAVVERMKKDENINFDEDWKVITLFVGGNDLCDFCEDTTKYGAEQYRDNLKKALDFFHANVPRAFINMVQILDIAIVKQLNANFVCDTLHLFLCKCAAFPKDSEDEKRLLDETDKYRMLMSDLINSGIYDTRDDFTVVIQPFFSQTSLPLKDDGKPDLSYFAPDCFHLSQKGHQAAAESLWNNMVEPVGIKKSSWTPGEGFQCPSATAPYFYTHKNSANNQLGASGPSVGEETPAGSVQVHSRQEEGNSDKNHEAGNLSTSLSIVLAAAGSLVLVAIVGAIVLKKKLRKSREERVVLLQQQVGTGSYTEI